MRHNEPVACPAFAKKGPRFTGLNSIDTTFYIQLSELAQSLPVSMCQCACSKSNSPACDFCTSDSSNPSNSGLEQRDSCDLKNTPQLPPRSPFSFPPFAREYKQPPIALSPHSEAMSPRGRCESDSPCSQSSSPRPKFNIKSIVREGNLFLFHLIAGEVVCSESADSLTKDLVSYLSCSDVPLLGVSRVYKCDVELSYDFESQTTTITRLRLVQEEDL